MQQIHGLDYAPFGSLSPERLNPLSTHLRGHQQEEPSELHPVPTQAQLPWDRHHRESRSGGGDRTRNLQGQNLALFHLSFSRMLAEPPPALSVSSRDKWISTRGSS